MEIILASKIILQMKKKKVEKININDPEGYTG